MVLIVFAFVQTAQSMLAQIEMMKEEQKRQDTKSAAYLEMMRNQNKESMERMGNHIAATNRTLLEVASRPPPTPPIVVNISFPPQSSHSRHDWIGSLIIIT
jgi:uncharacterized membrane protein (DUF106 family)